MVCFRFLQGVSSAVNVYLLVLILEYYYKCEEAITFKM